ncbi:pyrroloquinoline quinone biosynthesis peptide chaperone PqqD [Streptomyces sp. uw30]|uniref:pyrroloquinoline quinone biosynthesis peptide chaperone PqqD n=1 Tax=Streptomyces sp. uw30 TaxID=1828179 RepID=UPI0011CE066C|nr:pyrroloquinoline quinone biosynthesis peptide chaperone PqqD [Streptomyces sp. uw30]TXS49971.1 pyrroloquinoline quinone biosynthesis peptide chaperone PqqD [Streptomyces sp. uw30]
MTGDTPAAAGVREAEPVMSWRPALRRSVMLRHDRIRGCDLLLLPERVVVLHGAGGQILRLCDGVRDLGAIVAVLTERHPAAPVASEVPAFLARLREEGWLR